MNTLYIVRGVPGSGKSTLARKITPWSNNVCEADSFFENEKGEYRFDMTKLHEAHEFCYNKVKSCMENGEEIVTVANTFVKFWEYEKYITLAKVFGYATMIIGCHGNFKNTHGVPEEVVSRMKKNFEPTRDPKEG
jgi:predicted kinase